MGRFEAMLHFKNATIFHRDQILPEMSIKVTKINPMREVVLNFKSVHTDQILLQTYVKRIIVNPIQEVMSNFIKW